ncbi:MAG: hypothetical protein ACM3ZU_08090 [Bacteroidota bacterium]
MSFRTVTLKAIPYLASVAIGLALSSAGLRLGEDLKALFLNVASAFLAIPLLFLFYETFQRYSHRRLNVEVSDYVKMQIDRELLPALTQLVKILNPGRRPGCRIGDISSVLSLKKEAVSRMLASDKHLGFIILKRWNLPEDRLHVALTNSLIIGTLEDDQVIAVISIIKSLRYLQAVRDIHNLYLPAGGSAPGYKVVGEGATAFHDDGLCGRLLLLRGTGGGQFVVEDFGDFHRYTEEELLSMFVVNPELLPSLSEAIADFIDSVRNWLEKTGNEFIIDTKVVRLGVDGASNKGPEEG